MGPGCVPTRMCKVAERETGGAYFCGRAEGHAGPCATFPSTLHSPEGSSNMLGMSTALKSVLYSCLAAAVGAALPSVPAPYAMLASSLAAVVLLNLRNAWHVPAASDKASA